MEEQSEKNGKLSIDSLEIDEESIVILQEIPHQKLVNRSMWQWEETKMFHSFQESFEADYEIFYPRYLICSKQCTVALGRKLYESGDMPRKESYSIIASMIMATSLWN